MSERLARDESPPREPSAPTPQPAPLDSAVRDSAWVYASQGVFVFFKFLSGFLVARFLGPTLYGLRTIFGIIVEYEGLSHAGTFDAMQREVPQFRGRGRFDEADRVVENVFGLSVLYSAAAAVLLLAAAGVMYSMGQTGIWLIFVVFLAFYIGVARISGFYGILLIVDKKAKLLSQFRMFRGGLAGTLAVAAAFWYGLAGVLVGVLIAEIISLGWIMHRVRSVPRPRLSLSELGDLFAIGFPMLGIVLLFMALRSLDRILIAGFLDVELLGYFAVATVLANVMFDTLADVMRVVLFPRMMEAFGRDGSHANLREAYLIEPSLVVAYGLPFILGAVYLGVHLPIDYLVPEYGPAVAVTKILIMGQFFFAISLASVLAGIAINRQANVAALAGFAVIVNAVLNYSFIRAGYGIEGVAVGTGLSYVAFTLVATRFVLARMEAGWSATLRFLGLALVPFVYAVGLLLLWERVLLPDSAASALVELALTAVRILGFSLLYAPILLVVARRPAIVELRQTLSSALARRVA